jgi:hypothetical protein
MWYATSLVWVVLGIPFILSRSSERGPGALPLWFIVTWIASVIVGAYIALVQVAYEIRLTQDGILEFRSLLRTIQLDSRDVLSIAPARLNTFVLLFKARERTARTLRYMDALPILIVEIRKMNPQLAVRGL